MPSIADIVGVLESLQTEAVELLPERCVAVRNRFSSCRRCVEACAFDAIEVLPNDLSMDAQRCVNCGACVGACPTQALVGMRPLGEDIGFALAAATEACEGLAVVACARKASRHEAAPGLFVEAPCLGRMAEAGLVAAVAAGALEVVLVDGGCASCKYGAAAGAIDQAVEGARELLDAWGVDVPVRRASKFPDRVLAEDGRPAEGAERRRLLSQAGVYARQAAKTGAGQMVGDMLQRSRDATVQALRDRLKAGRAQAPILAPERNLGVLDGLDALGVPGPGAVLTRLFGRVSIDAGSCSGCGACFAACPTGALRRSEVEEPSAPDRQYVEFRAADCVQCGLCADVCLKGSIEVSAEVPVCELVDFEPRLIELPRPLRGAALFRKAYARNHG